MDEFDWGKGVALILSQSVLILLIAYLNYHYFLPRFLVKKSWSRYLLEFIGPFAVVIFLRIFLSRYIIDNYTHQERYFYSSAFLVQTIVITLFITIFIGFLRFVSDWFVFEAAKKEVENERLTAELNFLKAQINPHFLFNTLNNLYYLAYSKSPNTTEVIAKLSQVMRYMIYDSNHARVLLTKEIEYMENYIALERLRLNEQTSVDFKVSGAVQEAQIVPLILITFLENAFKHGVSNTSAASWVRISIDVQGNVLTYEVANSKFATGQSLDKSGIGLANVKRRLELVYANRYHLKVEDKADSYYIQLKLQLV